MVALVETLPPELYTAIILYLPSDDLQQTVSSLIQAVPHSPVPRYHLFEFIRLKRRDQVSKLYLHLRKSQEDAAYVRGFSLESWDVDADVLVNLVAILPQVRQLSLYIGPNFTPENLEEMFEEPKVDLRYIALRFRPYVQKATYYQFLKGAYFDSTLLALSRWPSSLPTLSIIQDPLEPSMAPTNFAQPLVFFRLDTLSSLARSPVSTTLLHFRMRIPARQVAKYIYAMPQSMSRLEVLDMSTCNVQESDVEGVLGRFNNLKTLLLDGCYIVSQRDMQDEGLGQWAALGKSISLAGVKYAKEREKKLKAWLEASYRTAQESEPEPVRPPPRPRPRRGRRGLATASISIRDSPPRDETPLPAPIPGGSQLFSGPIPRIRILPSLPIIQSLSTTPPSSIGPGRHAAIRAEFEKGWAEGVAQLTMIYGRQRASWRNGLIRVMRIQDEYSLAEKDGPCEVGLAGLVEVEDERGFEIDYQGDNSSDDNPSSLQVKCPVLCLAGPGRNDGHVEGCGHQVGWEVWQDEL